MWAMHDLVLMFLAFMVNLLLGMMVLGIVLLVTYLLRERIRNFFLFLWKVLHKDSYLDFLRREEAEKSIKENVK